MQMYVEVFYLIEKIDFRVYISETKINREKTRESYGISERLPGLVTGVSVSDGRYSSSPFSLYNTYLLSLRYTFMF